MFFCRGFIPSKKNCYNIESMKKNSIKLAENNNKLENKDPIPTPIKHRVRLSKAQKEALVIRSDVNELCIGMLMGDSSIEKHGNEARMKFIQGDSAFIDYLYSKFIHSGLVTAAPISISVKTKGKMFDSHRFCTITHPYFTEMLNKWYVKINNRNVKIIPHDIGELLTPTVLAY